jgi:hypothetical protein
MNILIANQYGRVQGEAGGCVLTLCGKAVVRISKDQQNKLTDHSH